MGDLKYTNLLKKSDYEKGSTDRAGITRALEDLKAKLPVNIPLKVGDKEVRSAIFHDPIVS